VPKRNPKTGNWFFVLDGPPDPATGKRRQLWRSGFETKKAAQTALDQLRRELYDNTYVARDDSAITFADYVEGEWLPAIDHTIEASTYESYERNLRIHVAPRIGGLKMRDLRAGHLDALYAELLHSGRRDGKGGLSARTVRYIATIVHRVLGDAVRKGRVAINVADAADPPSAKKARPPEMRYWTPEQTSEFLAFVKDHPLFPAFRLAAMTGMRRGEVFGLLWRDIDLDTGMVTVQRQLRVIAGKLDHVEITKSSAGRRTIGIDLTTVAVLREHRRRQLEDRLAVGARYQDRGLVFAESDGSFADPESAAKVFDRRVARSGLPRIRFHDLRHSHVAQLIAAGVHSKTIASRLGHASHSFTIDKYGHLLPDQDSSAAAAVAALVDG
jgi:integrase